MVWRPIRPIQTPSTVFVYRNGRRFQRGVVCLYKGTCISVLNSIAVLLNLRWYLHYFNEQIYSSVEPCFYDKHLHVQQSKSSKPARTTWIKHWKDCGYHIARAKDVFQYDILRCSTSIHIDFPLSHSEVWSKCMSRLSDLGRIAHLMLKIRSPGRNLGSFHRHKWCWRVSMSLGG